ncbi:unnamed protein product [Lactuca saligna]|uniref:Uncharacterized protein n=1 Tax=Lactuca saligna TaxID=75948 RepID=A0AA35XYM8_LACSI|nr:unnamed protein product [Lactuca saligna]
MATQASLFALVIPNQTSPWKQSQPISFNKVKPSKPTTRFTTIKVAVIVEVPTKEAPMRFIPPKIDPNTSSPIFIGIPHQSSSLRHSQLPWQKTHYHHVYFVENRRPKHP